MSAKEVEEILYVLKAIVIGRATRLTCREADKLLSYIEQLETQIENLQNNRDKALKKLNKYRNRKDHYGLWCMEYIDNADIIHTLKGDSDDE